jgi:hypothetical protein
MNKGMYSFCLINQKGACFVFCPFFVVGEKMVCNMRADLSLCVCFFFVLCFREPKCFCVVLGCWMCLSFSSRTFFLCVKRFRTF